MNSISILLILTIICSIQVYCSSMVNRGKSNIYSVVMFILGMGVSYLWVLLSRCSTNLIRDGLIWDIIVSGIFTILLVLLGHGQHFTLKHWIAVALTIGVFLYWGMLK